ncbi:hypothetical protein LSTR_LSTR012828 [Laodelphax striatellus]|uniref:Uncharacterized protein n=1 Tax=Laodelphax striatellus TaxID=195883 RepID=A0A482XDI6_LAOST|nr:hypothetical protein LSTR_LSTR012828 [Laodelphax striatellus]
MTTNWVDDKMGRRQGANTLSPPCVGVALRWQIGARIVSQLCTDAKVDCCGCLLHALQSIVLQREHVLLLVGWTILEEGNACKQTQY